MSLEQLTSRYLSSVDGEMRAAVRDAEEQQSDLFGMLRYHLGWVDASFKRCDAGSGKRVRPVLCLMSCESCGGSWQQALPAAAAVELLHNFTLIHDDIEDQDETRRGRPTVWSVWGEAQGVNAGDTLFAISQLAILRLRQEGVPASTVVEAARLFNETCVALTGGQHLDIEFENRKDVAVEDYQAMIEGKTAALVSCSCELGALIAGAPASQREHLRAFGRHSGLAFQMLDDILGIWGNSLMTGKPVGADIARRKKTLPLLHGLERSPELRTLMSQDTLSDADVRYARRLLEEVGSREYAERLARDHHEAALTALGRANLREPAAGALRELAHELLNRRH
jgi:geranylgeranyl diphosphate synthase type I